MTRIMCVIFLLLSAGLVFCGCQTQEKEGKTDMDVVDKPWPVWNVAFSPDGSWLAAGRGYRSEAKFWLGGRGDLNVWTVKDWKLHPGFSGQFTIWTKAIVFTPNSKNLIAASDIYIQSDPQTGGPVVGTPNPWGGNAIFVWDMPDGSKSRNWRFHKGRGAVASLAVNASGEFIALGRGGDTVPVLNVKTGRQIYEIEDISRWVDFSPDGKSLAVTSGMPSVHLYDAATGKNGVSLDLTGKELSLTCLRYSPDGKQVAVGMVDGSVRVLAGDLSKQLRSLEVSGDKERVLSLAYAAKADLLAATTASKVRLFEASSGKKLRDWSKADLMASSVALSPDGKLLAVGYGGEHNGKGERRGGFVNIWDTKTGRLVKKLD